MSSIELDTTKAGGTAANIDAPSAAFTAAPKATAALLGGLSVTVTDGTPNDLEALVAYLRNENERAKSLTLLSTLASISQSLSDEEKGKLQEGLALSEKIDELNKMLDGYDQELRAQKNQIAILQLQIEQLQKQIDQAVKDGKEHNRLVQGQRALRKELDEKERAMTKTTDAINQTKSEIASATGQLDVLVRSIGSKALTTIAKDVAALADPEKAKRPAETDAEEKNAAETNPFATIRDALSAIERELQETIEEKRVATV